jgi:diguanylate cyclase (GGDEF)-like protein
MLLASVLPAAGASAQALPSIPTVGASPTGGVEVEAGPGGVNLGVDGGDTGGVNVGAGPGGVNLDLRTTPKQSAPAPAPQGNSSPAPGSGTASERPAGSGPAQAAPDSGGGEAGPGRTGEGRRGNATSRRGRAESVGSAGADGAGVTPTVDGRSAATRAKQDDRGAVAPVFDLIDRIPTAVRAGLVALALIALAMWALWVRGRRRLENNAYMDPDSEVANMAAFEQILDREWERASRYHRPLGLLLLEIEQSDAAGIRLLGERQAKDVVEDIGLQVRQSDTVARLSDSRFAVICPEAPVGSVETLAHAIEHRLEERRLRCWASFGERIETDDHPSALVARAASRLAGAQVDLPAVPAPEAPAEQAPMFAPDRPADRAAVA